MNKVERAYELQQHIVRHAMDQVDISEQAAELDRICDTMTSEEAERFLDLCEGKA